MLLKTTLFACIAVFSALPAIATGHSSRYGDRSRPGNKYDFGVDNRNSKHDDWRYTKSGGGNDCERDLGGFWMPSRSKGGKNICNSRETRVECPEDKYGQCQINWTCPKGWNNKIIKGTSQCAPPKRSCARPSCPSNTQWNDDEDRCECPKGSYSWNSAKGKCVPCGPQPSTKPNQPKPKRGAPARQQSLSSYYCSADRTACFDKTGTFEECIDADSDINNCGGCVSEGKGQDCTVSGVVPNAKSATCVRGQCQPIQCAAGFSLVNGNCI